VGVVKPSLIYGDRCDANPSQAGETRAATETEREGHKEKKEFVYATVRPLGKMNLENQTEMI
jgi:hypothetical protein